MPSLNHRSHFGKSLNPNGGKPRGEGPAAVREAFDLSSNDSAQKHIDRAFGGAIREAQILVLRPGADLSPIVAHVAHLTAMLETGPARPLNEALLKDGVVSRAQDEARELCLNEATPDVLALVESRIRRELAEGFAFLRDLHAHREGGR